MATWEKRSLTMKGLILNDFGNRLFINHEGHQPELIVIYNMVFDRADDLLINFKSNKKDDSVISAVIMYIIFDLVQLMIKLPTWSLVSNMVSAFGNCFRDLQSAFIEGINISCGLPDKTTVSGSDLDFIKGVAMGLFSLVDENIQPTMRINYEGCAWKLLYRLCSIKLDGKMSNSAIKDDRNYMSELTNQIRRVFGDKKLSLAEKVKFKNNFSVFKNFELNLVGEALVTELFYAVVKPTDQKEKINLLLNI